MLIFSKERLVPTDVNMLVIYGEEAGGYFYIHRALYDQAVIIHDIYEEDTEQLLKAVTGVTTSRPDVETFMATAPSPINMFGPFLMLVKSELETFEDMVGAIHVMSGPMHLRKMLKIPFEMRNSIPRFSLSIKEEYKLAWDRFFLNTMPYSDDMLFRGNMAMNGANTSTVSSSGSNSDIAAELGFDPDEMIDMGDGTMVSRGEYELLTNCDDDFFNFGDDDEDEEIDYGTQEAAAEPEPELEPEPEPEPVEEKKPLSGVDALLML